MSIPLRFSHFFTTDALHAVLGYVFGPLLWGPLSERYGRKNIFLVAFVPYIGFQIGCALSPNVGALLVFRFLGGVFASSPLTKYVFPPSNRSNHFDDFESSGGVIADMWGPKERGNALALFSLAPFAGPALAPICSGALTVSNTYFAWIFWILTIFAGLCLVAIVRSNPRAYYFTLTRRRRYSCFRKRESLQ